MLVGAGRGGPPSVLRQIFQLGQFRCWRRVGEVPIATRGPQGFLEISDTLPMNRKVGQASRLPRRRSRPQTCHLARAGALAGEAGRLPYAQNSLKDHLLQRLKRK